MQTQLHSEVFAALDAGVVIYEAVNDGQDFCILAMNPVALAISQVEEKAVLGKLLRETFPGAEQMGIVDALRTAHRTGVKQQVPPLPYTEATDTHASTRDGWYQNDVYRLSGGLLMTLFWDVSENINTRAELAEIETQYQLLEEALPDGVFHWHIANGGLPSPQTVYFSDVCRAQLGFSDNEMPNDLQLWAARLHPDSRHRTLATISDFIMSEETLWDFEFQLRHKQGHYLWIRSRGKLVRDANTGLALRVLGVHMNVDEDRRRQEALAEQRRATDALFAALPDLFFLVDAQGQILNYQASSTDKLYTPPKNFLGKTMAEVLPEEVGKGLMTSLGNALKSGALTSTEYSLTVNESLEHFDCRIAPTPDGRAAFIIRNVSDAKRAEHALSERMKELQGLYEIHRRSQTDTELHSFAQHVCDQVAASMQSPREVRASLVLNGRTWHSGKESVNGPRLRVPISGDAKSIGSIEVTFTDAVPPISEELEFLKGAASSVSLWLSNRQALDNAMALEKVLASTDSEVALLNEHFVYQIVNPAYAASHGMTVAQMTGRPIAEVLGNEYPSSGIEEKLREAQQGKRIRFQQWRDAEDKARRIDVTFAPYTDAQVHHGVAVSIHDITPLHEAEAKLRRVAEVFSSSAEAVMMTEADGSIIDVNNAFTKITGFSHSEATGKTPAIISSQQHSPQFFKEMFRLINLQDRWQGEIWNRRKNGEIFPCLLTVSSVRDDRGKLSGYVASFNDITNIKQNEHRLELLARQDPLTALPNRSHLRQTLDSRLARTTSGDHSTTILFIDLDHFKDINDSMGHSAGDELLKVCSSRLLDSLRDDDILARVGGDEFVALLFDMRSYENVATIASKLIVALEEPIAIGGETVQISASIGVCRHPDDGADTETLLRNADTAMYVAKKAGRGTWKCYSQTMTDVATRHLLLSGALREALKNNDLEIVYQPKYDVASLQLTGFEALSRWESPGFGTVSPEEFIAIAENNGLIVELDYKVLDRVCVQLSRWTDAGFSPPKIAVNVSGRTLQQADFYQQVTAILARHNIKGEDLEFELTETALLPQPEKQANILDQIRALGLTISIDDFGTGYSSLSYLQRLPVSTLKIDASFVREISVSKDADAIAEAIIAMARALDMGIVAEGVESELQASFLRSRGPMSVQGFLYSKAVSADSARDLLATSTKNPRTSSF